MRQLTNKKKIYFYFFIFIFLTTAINTNYSKNFLKYLNVKSIDIIGLDFEDQIRLKKNLDILKNKNIFLIKDDELLNILQKYNEFEDYKIQKIFPKKLKIEIRKTAYIAKTLIDGKEFLIGENKKFIEFKNYMLDQDLPVVFGNFPIHSFINLQENLKKIRAWFLKSASKELFYNNLFFITSFPEKAIKYGLSSSNIINLEKILGIFRIEYKK